MLQATWRWLNPLWSLLKCNFYITSRHIMVQRQLHFIKTLITDDFPKAARPGQVHGIVWKMKKQKPMKKFAAPKNLNYVTQMHTKLWNRSMHHTTTPNLYLNLMLILYFLNSWFIILSISNYQYCWFFHLSQQNCFQNVILHCLTYHFYIPTVQLSFLIFPFLIFSLL